MRWPTSWSRATGWTRAARSTPPSGASRVPRHCFLPGVSLEDAYDIEKAPVTKRTSSGAATSSVSAPWLQALMLRDAGLCLGDTVIEVGSGGYNAALAKEVVGPHGTVLSIDIDPWVTDRARRFLDDTGYHQVIVHLGDGETIPTALAAPGNVDAVIVTVEARDISPSWGGCLEEGGRLVVPLRIHGYTWVIPFTKRGGALVADTYIVCGFVALQGPGYREDHIVQLRGGEITVRFADGIPTDTSRLDAALDMPCIERWTGITIPGNVPFDMLLLWLATHLERGVRPRCGRPRTRHRHHPPPRGLGRCCSCPGRLPCPCPGPQTTGRRIRHEPLEVRHPCPRPSRRRWPTSSSPGIATHATASARS
ncbi:hypothetical protein [Streptomyces wuyuanensis]|uniref:hypothetical protein n=1 Tax=Streptomyces wuyuanensis TaxID=1196353 RepID=UPI00372120C3